MDGLEVQRLWYSIPVQHWFSAKVVPYFGSLIDRGVFRDLTTPVDDLLDSRVLGLERSPAHIVRYQINFMRDIAKSYRPSQVPLKLPGFLKHPIDRVLRWLFEYPCSKANC